MSLINSLGNSSSRYTYNALSSNREQVSIVRPKSSFWRSLSDLFVTHFLPVPGYQTQQNLYRLPQVLIDSLSHTIKMASLPTPQDLEFASIFLGLFAGLFVFTTMKVARQSWRIWGRTKSLVNFYLWAIWIETIVNFVFALTTYLYIRGNILPR